MKRYLKASAAAVALFSTMFSAPAIAEGTLTLTLPAMPTGYPIVSSAGLADIIVGNVVFEGLTRWKKDSLEVEPSLAVSWTPNEDSTVWTFTLRDDVKWHDGQPFTSDDVKFTFDILLDKQIRSAAAGQVSTLTSVEVVSPTEVKLSFSQPNASLPLMLAYRMPIVPKHLLDGKDLNQPAEFIAQPIGTGAFKFAEAASGQFWNTERNADWWGGNVELDEVLFKIMPDANSAVAQLRAGNTDVALIRPQQISALEGSDIGISAIDQPSVYYVSLYNTQDPFQDVNVRRALNYAVDKEGIIKAVVDGYASVSSGMIAPSISGYSEIAPYPYEPEKAKELLREAGWSEEGDKWTKDGASLAVELTTSTGVIGGPQLAQIIQQQLKDIGVEATIKTVDFRELYTGVFAGSFQTSVEYLNMQPSADIQSALGCGGSQNRFAYCDAEVDRLFGEANAAPDEKSRNEKYAEIQRHVAQNPPGIWLYFPKEIRAISERVKGFPENPMRMATTHLFDVTVED